MQELCLQEAEVFPAEVKTSRFLDALVILVMPLLAAKSYQALHATAILPGSQSCPPKASKLLLLVSPDCLVPINAAILCYFYFLVC